MKTRFIAVLLAFVFGLTTASAGTTMNPPPPVMALDDQAPIQPPFIPGERTRSIIPDSVLRVDISHSYTYTLYLPFIQTPSPWAMISSREASRNYFLTYYVSDTHSIPILWTGSNSTCVPGTTSVTFRDAVLRRVNFYRAVAGVPDNVTFTADYNRITQAAALMMARNNSLNHMPPTSWACYSIDGSNGAGRSNLALGANGTAAIDLYMQDSGANNGVVGHRRWVLYPQTQEMGTGDVPYDSLYPPANSLHAWDSHIWEARPTTREAFVAWPPAGYVPHQIVTARWSFSYPQADFTNAVVTMLQGSTPIAVSMTAPVNGYGENTLVWIPNGMQDNDPWPKPLADTIYHLAVNHVVIGGQDRTFLYDVVVFDPQN